MYVLSGVEKKKSFHIYYITCFFFLIFGALHRRPGVVKNEQRSSHLSRRVRRVRKLVERVFTFESTGAKGKEASRTN